MAEERIEDRLDDTAGQARKRVSAEEPDQDDVEGAKRRHLGETEEDVEGHHKR